MPGARMSTEAWVVAIIGIAALFGLLVILVRQRRRNRAMFIPSGDLDRYSRTGFFSTRTEKRGSSKVRS